MFPGDSWETERWAASKQTSFDVTGSCWQRFLNLQKFVYCSGRELFAAAPNSFVVHDSDSCQLTFDLACLLRPSQQQSDGLQPLSQQLPVESAHRRRSQSALEAEFSGTATEEQLAGCGEVTDSAFYARWLHVKAGCLEDAKQAILNHCTWRASTSPGGIQEVGAQQTCTMISSVDQLPDSSTHACLGKSILDHMHGVWHVPGTTYTMGIFSYMMSARISALGSSIQLCT